MEIRTILSFSILSSFILSTSLCAMLHGSFTPAPAVFYNAFIVSIDKYSASNDITHLKNAQRSLSGLYQHNMWLEQTKIINTFLNTSPKNLVESAITIEQLKKDVSRKYQKNNSSLSIH